MKVHRITGARKATNTMPQNAPEDTTEMSCRDQDTDTETIDTIDSVANVGRDLDEVTSTEQPSTSKREAKIADPPKQSKWKSFMIRARTTFILIGSFCFFIWMGHVPLMAMILGIQYLMVKELYTLAEKAHRRQNLSEKRKPPKWLFFFVATFWQYFRFVQKQLIVEFKMNPTIANLLGWTINQHSVIAFALYVGGFVWFVLKLEKGYYLVQFRQYAWVHLILLFVFMPSSFFVSNIFDGIIWFLLPCSMVIINDIGAYLAGIAIGRTPLIKLSPKKTWEGFFGGLLMTLVGGWFLADWMSHYKWLVCPRTDLSMGWLHCEPDDLFIPKMFGTRDLTMYAPATVAWLLSPVTALLQTLADSFNVGDLRLFTFVARPIQLHSLVMALFASLIAPFGGFFASGFKRSFKIKDFGDSIPGHGGMTDRMDCQVVMAVFSYLYYNNYVAKLATVSLGTVLNSITQMDSKAQFELFNQLGSMLAAKRQIPEGLIRELSSARNSTLFKGVS